MESMAPTAVMSYASGWMSTLGWLASVASSTYVVTTQVEAMIQVTNSEYAFARWQATLIMLAFTVLTIFFNTWGAPVLPALEVACLVGHLAAFLVVLIPLWVLCSKNSADDVFLHFEDNSGWGNIGTAYLISQVYVMYCNLGSDSVVHISEEVEDASFIVPRATWWSYLGNVAMGILTLITMLFCIGPLDSVLEADIPYLLLFNNTGSPGLSIALNVILFLLIYAGYITALSTYAREMFAFARDKGLPWSKQAGRTDKKWNVPFNAVTSPPSRLCYFRLLTSVRLWLSTSFIGYVLLKRIKGEPLPPARWSLGRFGLPINAFCLPVLGLHHHIQLISDESSDRLIHGQLGASGVVSSDPDIFCLLRQETLHSASRVC
ncbi:hypothetical protein AC579_2450 [Pseudocercospora musae]|uniref:Amino acid permease/ SLC12A domain-containing protein n=1 Tax=Pseudocercospora musae TaxID=113226 RepID=A0A139IHQ1_9PEZI|nr:hypothetical protein AC579_2450 [Pseudocercospora musae]